MGDIIAFGHYPQGANGEVKPIEWQVLRCDNDSALVISKYALDCKKYNERYGKITWAECTLRQWLNSEFLNKAFNATERAQIRQKRLRNPNSKWNNVPGGSATEDKIFCLSHDEALDLFANDGQRQGYPTAYAKSRNVWTSNKGVCYWWLRSPGGNVYYAACVNGDGGFSSDSANHGRNAVRPALYLALGQGT